MNADGYIIRRDKLLTKKMRNELKAKSKINYTTITTTTQSNQMLNKWEYVHLSYYYEYYLNAVVNTVVSTLYRYRLAFNVMMYVQIRTETLVLLAAHFIKLQIKVKRSKSTFEFKRLKIETRTICDSKIAKFSGIVEFFQSRI